MNNEIADDIQQTALAFRGYNVTNLGRSSELMAIAAYRKTIEASLTEAANICSDMVQRKVDLVDRVKHGKETSLSTYDEAIALIAAMEISQLKLLQENFDTEYRDAQMCFGYSLGEIIALVASGVLDMEQALKIPLSMSHDCAALANGVTMGVLFSREEEIELDLVKKLLLEINNQGSGIIGISAILSPNTLLMLGQDDTVDRFHNMMNDVLPKPVHLRKNPHHWPPLHTPLVWEKNITTRSGVMMHTLGGVMDDPRPPVFSLVSGEANYTGLNCREILYHWVEQPQLLWEAVEEVLTEGVQTIVHVGPEPNLIPATFKRLSNNVLSQLDASTLGAMGLRAVSRLTERAWLSRMLPSRASLLRAPKIKHIILEDWLIEHAPID